MRVLRADIVAGELLGHVAIEVEDHALEIELASVGVPLMRSPAKLCGPVCVLVVP